MNNGITNPPYFSTLLDVNQGSLPTPTAPPAERLLPIHVTTLFVLDRAGRLVRANTAGGGPPPRLLVGTTPNSRGVWTGECISHELREAVETTAIEEFAPGSSLIPPYCSEPYVRLLAAEAPVTSVWAGLAYCCDTASAHPQGVVALTPKNVGLLHPDLADWGKSAFAGQPTLVALEGGQAVAVCGSVRVGRHAHEAGVETAPGFRAAGHGRRVVAGWAATVRQAGRIPLYSAAYDNGPSHGLARGLGLVPYGMVVHVR